MFIWHLRVTYSSSLSQSHKSVLHRCSCIVLFQWASSVMWTLLHIQVCNGLDHIQQWRAVQCLCETAVLVIAFRVQPQCCAQPTHSRTEFHGQIERRAKGQIPSSPQGKTQWEPQTVYNFTVYSDHFLDSQTHEHSAMLRNNQLNVVWHYQLHF